ncbi:MAG: hypothetical protein ACREXK_12210 [Gammaproteobacteria bacterium]
MDQNHGYYGPHARPTPLGSLKRLLLAYELALMLLVVVTGMLGGLWAYFWSQTTRESFRLGTLTASTAWTSRRTTAVADRHTHEG